MKNRKIQVHLFGTLGERTTEVSTRGGFPTRHIKAPRETAPSLFEPDAEKVRTAQQPSPATLSTSKTDLDPATQVLEILRQMHAGPEGWIIFDEIILVARVQQKLQLTWDSLRDALRSLYRQKQVEHQQNRFGQDCFRLVGKLQNTHLKALLTEVNAIMGVGDAS